jgi:hypothetical protein
MKSDTRVTFSGSPTHKLQSSNNGSKNTSTYIPLKTPVDSPINRNTCKSEEEKIVADLLM